MDSAAKVAVIGQTVARQLFGNDDPIDAVIRIRNIPFRVVGVFAARADGPGPDQDDTVMIPYTTMQKRLMRITFVQSIVVQRRRAPSKLPRPRSRSPLLLRQRHRIADGRDDDFTVAISPTSPKRRRARRG